MDVSCNFYSMENRLYFKATAYLTTLIENMEELIGAQLFITGNDIPSLRTWAISPSGTAVLHLCDVRSKTGRLEMPSMPKGSRSYIAVQLAQAKGDHQKVPR